MHWQTPWAVRLLPDGTVDPSFTRACMAWAARLRAGETTELDRAAAIIEPPAPTGGVQVITLRGLITPRGSFLSLLFGGGGGLQAFRSQLREALHNDEVGSILIDVDSPGGSTDLLTETAAEIREARGDKPIVAISNTIAASAAYWIASQADELVVTPSGEVGSIGVFAVHEDWSQFNESFGVLPTYIAAGKYKTEGNPDEPLDDAAKAALQATIDEFYGLFVDDVAAGRGVTSQVVRDDFGEGRMVTAKRAVSLGMADRVESFEATVARLTGARGRQGRESARRVQIERADVRELCLAQPRHRTPKEGSR